MLTMTLEVCIIQAARILVLNILVEWASITIARQITACR